VPILGRSEWRHLRLFAWFLLIINLCIVGVALLFGRALESFRDALLIGGAVALLVNLAFLLIVGGNVLWVVLSRRRRETPSPPPD